MMIFIGYIVFAVLIGIIKTWYYVKFERKDNGILMALELKTKMTLFLLFLGHTVFAPLFFGELVYIIAKNKKEETK